MATWTKDGNRWVANVGGFKVECMPLGWGNRTTSWAVHIDGKGLERLTPDPHRSEERYLKDAQAKGLALASDLLAGKVQWKPTPPPAAPGAAAMASASREAVMASPALPVTTPEPPRVLAIRPLTEADVTFATICEPENDVRPEDQLEDPDSLRWVREQLNAGNQWAWCTVIVRATWKAPNGRVFRNEDLLGGCSYKSQADFETPDGYYADMKREALQRLNAEIERTFEALQALIH